MEGPLSKLLRGLGMETLPPIPRVEPIGITPVELNPETIFHEPERRVIDLRKRYDIAMNHRPWLRCKDEHFEAYDRVSFDSDPESRWHIFGYGASSTEATSDLLAKIAAEVAKGD